MAYTNRPFNYTGTLPNQVQNDLGLANDNFDILGQAFIGNDPSSKPIKRAVYIGASPPADAVANTLWFDTSVSPPVLKVYNGTNWQLVSSSNADTVDGFHASQTPAPNTIPVAGSTGKLDAGWLPAVGNFNQVEFTSSGTWVVPSGVTRIIIIAVAGGGGGAGGALDFYEHLYYNGMGGECGHGYIGVKNVTPGETLTITIGAGGAGGVGGWSDPSGGGSGGNTIITGSVSGVILSLQGGRGGGGSWNGFVSYGYPSIFGRFNLGYGSGGDGGVSGGNGNNGIPGAVRIIYFV